MNPSVTEKQRREIAQRPDDILDLLLELRSEAKRSSDNIKSEAKATELVVSGVVNKNIYQIYGARQDQISIKNDVLGGLIKTYASMMTRNRPTCQVVAKNKTFVDLQNAKFLTKVIEYYENENDVDEKIQRAVEFGATHGTGMLKIYFDKKKKMVCWEPLSIFDVELQNCQDPSEVRWCLIRKMVDKWKAYELIHSANPKYQGMPAESYYEDAAGQRQVGVEVFEIWHKPDYRFPTGLFATVIDTEVVEASVFPNRFIGDAPGEFVDLLPVVWFTAAPNRGSTLGTTFSFKSRSSQVIQDELLTGFAHTAMLNKPIQALPESISDEMFDPGNLILRFKKDQIEEIKASGWLETAKIDALQYDQAQQLPLIMQSTAGISEVSLGNASASQSGTAQAYQAELDTNKHSQAIKSIKTMIKNAWTVHLKLLQQNVDEISLPDVPMTFATANISGFSLALEPRSQRESLENTKVENTKKDVMAGILPAESLAEVQPGEMDIVSREIAEGIVTQFLTTGEVEITPETVPEQIMKQVAFDHLRKALDMQDYGAAEAINHFIAEYSKLVAVEPTPGPDVAPAAPSPEPQDSPLPESLGDEFLSNT